MSEQEKPNKEQQILEVAEYEFLTKGYNGTRTVTIAEKAGVTHAMLHYYFRTKEHLFERIVSDKLGLISQMVFSVIGNSELSLIERLRDGISTHFDFVAANPLLPRFFINEVLSYPERYHIVLDKLKETVYKVYGELQREIDEAAERGMIKRIDVVLLFTSILSLNIFPIISLSLVEQMFEDSDKFDKARYLEARKRENIELILSRILK